MSSQIKNVKVFRSLKNLRALRLHIGLSVHLSIIPLYLHKCDFSSDGDTLSKYEL